MILLPMAYIKDAARAVKRICRQEFTECTDTVLTTLLGIPGLVVRMYGLRREGDEEVLHLMCAHRSDVAMCPKCRAICEEIHDEEERCIRHLDIWGKKTFLHFLSRRFVCDCGNEFTEELQFVDQWRRQSKNFEFHIYESCLKCSRKQVALREGLSQSTVREIFNRWTQFSMVKSGRALTTVLGIDEISLKKRHKQFALVISDIERRCILEILPVRDKEALEQWIDSLSEAQRRAIRCVSIDMWAPYFHAVRNRLPKAKIVVDRFHVMKHLNERITQLRSNMQKSSVIDIQEILKGSRWILVRNRAELSLQDEDKLRRILESCPELRVLYLLKEEFRLIFEKATNRGQAERFLSVWRLKAELTGNKYLMRFTKTLKNWWQEILNYFIERVTNGFVDGLNCAIRNIIRRAFGYRNFENFRHQVFAEQGFPTKLQ